jgi:TetR/AcrR family transcriptional repressor of mexJK operon
MDQGRETRWDSKHRLIVEAATATFLAKGYAGTSMDDIAAGAAVSKQTVYKHFSDKEQLFTAVVLATTDQVNGVVRMVADALEDTADVRHGVTELARSLLTALMRPELLRLRRLVIATADQFPEIGTAWYEQGFGRVLAALAERFDHLSRRGFLQIDDALLAAHHFVGLLLWIPVNRAMFTGDHDMGKADLESYADAAVRTFLRAYGVAPVSSGPKRRARTVSAMVAPAAPDRPSHIRGH